jgi:hypothetical protein
MSTSPPPSVGIHADEVVGGIVHRRCPRCDVLKPLDLFGLRTMRANQEPSFGGKEIDLCK